MVTGTSPTARPRSKSGVIATHNIATPFHLMPAHRGDWPVALRADGAFLLLTKPFLYEHSVARGKPACWRSSRSTTLRTMLSPLLRTVKGRITPHIILGWPNIKRSRYQHEGLCHLLALACEALPPARQAKGEQAQVRHIVHGSPHRAGAKPECPVLAPHRLHASDERSHGDAQPHRFSRSPETGCFLTRSPGRATSRCPPRRRSGQCWRAHRE